MDSPGASAIGLREQIAIVEFELKKLREQLANIEANGALASLESSSRNEHESDNVVALQKWPLSQEEYRRYGRQMIVPGFGIQGQLRLKNASVLIVGAGGLGCPAAAYIAGAGVGTLGIVDGDIVEVSNLHRQILHNTLKLDSKKVESAIEYLFSLNPNVAYRAHKTHLTPQNSADIVSQYDLVLDCTDHPTSRYLISDICVLLQKPLVSASALRTDGQLIVLNSPPSPAGDASGGPCYRCVFPKPPPAESVVSCGDGGILGPAVGTMGTLQALEAIKLIIAGNLTPPKVKGDLKPNPASMLLFSSNSSPPFRSVKLRSRRSGCFACSLDARLELESLRSGSLDYVLFCGATAPIRILNSEERIEAVRLKEVIQNSKSPYLLVDVREKVQFDICNLEGSINVPFSTVQAANIVEGDEQTNWIPKSFPNDAPMYIVCRLGNDSQVVVRKLKDAGLGNDGLRYIGDIRDGFKSWRRHVDSSWPDY